MKWTAALFCMAISTAVSGADYDPEKRAQELTEAFYSGRTDEVWNAMEVPMQQAMGSQESLHAFYEQVTQQLGGETQLVSEKIVETQGYHVYQRISQFSKISDQIMTQWALNAEGLVGGFFVRPMKQEASNAYENYQTLTALELPFEGEWYVFWGGRDAEHNYHVYHNDQRYAYDFLVVKGGKSHTGTGTDNVDYHCWGQSILAPAAGQVVMAVNNLPDNPPGEMDPGNPAGNHVVIDHQNGEYSLLAHLQQGSVTVEAGNSVTSGQKLGLCGNSGNTTEPHLHYHLQNSPQFGQGHGLPAPFNHYKQDGQSVDRGEPIKGQSISR